MKIRPFFYGALTGAILASIATLLIAPTSGKELQKKCKAKGRSLQQSIEQMKHDGIQLKDRISKTSKMTSEALKTVGPEIKTSLDQWKEDVDPSLQKLKDDIEQLQKAVSVRTEQ
ncbi:YtxH domain-containing protein [Halalkalibacterium halodurans]|uniref:YtxH domain-containing protein n=1 Tax=Halalkalibacterium halodurans TaxID=86665 RepID=UPI002E1B457D|nr:YtxH domain-containing protein [Halalkalibacterium halodurans]